MNDLLKRIDELERQMDQLERRLNGQLHPRKLHVAWVDAGERRRITRALSDASFSNAHIARVLQVSSTTVWQDLRA